MNLHELAPVMGSTHVNKRKGRGTAPGNGKTAGKGTKGQGAHSHTKKNGFEGGQMPIARRFPKFGFRKTHRGVKTVYVTINLAKLDSAFKDGDTVNVSALREKKMIKKEYDGLKILGNGKLTKKLIVEAKAFSASAKEAIEAAGGEAKVLK